MALYYSLVFGLLVFEMALFLVLSLPLPRRLRKPLLTTISKPFHSKEVQIAIKCVLAFILVLFVDAVNRVVQIKLELSPLVQRQKQQDEGGLLPSAIAPPPMGASLLSTNPEVQARKFYAERNMYLCGFTLFLTLIVNRTYALVHELLVLKDVATEAETTTKTEETEEVKELKKSIAEKDESLDILKEQATSLSKDYDEISTKK